VRAALPHGHVAEPVAGFAGRREGWAVHVVSMLAAVVFVWAVGVPRRLARQGVGEQVGSVFATRADSYRRPPALVRRPEGSEASRSRPMYGSHGVPLSWDGCRERVFTARPSPQHRQILLPAGSPTCGRRHWWPRQRHRRRASRRFMPPSSAFAS
jgi:hypothetical protein